MLVVTAALRKEIPVEWFRNHRIPVYTLEGLKSGILAKDRALYRDILVVITGAGINASEEAAEWILEHLSPTFVLNIGTCGLTTNRLPLGEWIRPRYVSDESGCLIELDTRLPIPYPEILADIDSLLTVKEARSGILPRVWRRHDAIDMECHAQARVFRETPVSFHCLKFSSDYSDRGMHSSFNRYILLLKEEIKRLFSFIEFKRENIKVSTVIPVYNRKRTIERAIDSVLKQSSPPAEVIVVDDGSTDGTADIIRGYRDRRIIPVFLPENSGPSRARNEGIKRASSDWIALLDSDDCWERDKIERQLEYLDKNPYYQIMQSEEKWIRNGRRVNPCKHHRKPVGWIWERSLERCLISPSAVLVKKSILERYGGFDEDMPACEDYDLWLRISRHHPVGLEPGYSVVKYGGHADQLSRRYPAMDRFRVRSLLRLLENERNPRFREKIIPVLEKKLRILIKGYKKRGKIKELEESLQILSSLQVSAGY